jgi:hypothetical protein
MMADAELLFVSFWLAELTKKLQGAIRRRQDTKKRFIFQAYKV